MEDYDEDLSENSWYLAFTHVHGRLFTQATNERWMICIPRMGSWRGGPESPKSFDADSFESHCIRFDCEETCQKKDENERGSSPKHVNKYVTYNGKTVLIDGSKIICGSGFAERATSFDSRSGQLELPADGVNHYARVLFEETYFNSNDQSYKMLCLSRPLTLQLISEEKIENPSEESPLSPLSGVFRFNSSKLQGYHLWGRASNAEKLKGSIDVKLNLFIKQHGQGKGFANEQIPATIEGKESMQLDEMDHIRLCVNSVKNLFDQCVQIVMKDSKIKKEVDHASVLEATKCAVERYVLHEIYGSVFRQISSFVADQEAAFNKTTRNLSNIHLKEVGVDEKYLPSLPKAKRKLSRINKFCTPHDKLSCLQQTVYCITANRDAEVGALGSDDLLPIFIYLVIKCNVPNWITNLMYLQHFQLMPVSVKQYSFYLATLEAAIEHIKQGSLKDKLLLKNEAKLKLSTVEQYFMATQNGDIEHLKEMLCESAKAREIQEKNMCHPLCACDKCSEFKRRTMHKATETVSVKTRNEKGQTALHVAASFGHHEIVDLLVNSGAELNAVDYHNSTPLHAAALSGSQSVVFLLLHYGANANAVDNNNNTPLHLCCQRGHEASVKAFLYFDPSVSVVNVNARNDEGDTPLHIASRWGYEGIVSTLIECGSNPKALNRRRQTAVDVSHNTRVSNTIKVAASQVIKIVRTLKHLQPSKENKAIESKKIEKTQRHRSMTPKELQDTVDNVYAAKQVEKLFRAVSDNDINMVKFLCGWQSAEDDNRTKDSEGPSCHPLCQCTKCQPMSHEHVLHANSNNEERYTSLMITAKHGFVDMAKLFLEHNASVNAKTKRHSHSALHFACENGHPEVAGLILSQEGANADIRDVSGSTPLYMSAIYNFPDCAKVLLKGGASVNIRNRNGDTPLHAAVKWQNIEVIKLLLEHGALVYYKNNDGETPVDFAQKVGENKDPEILSILMSAMQADEGMEPEMSVSPHSVTSQPRTLLTPALVADDVSKEESASAHDEAIADNLYTRFKDPPPPTPPPMGDEAIPNFDLLETDKLVPQDSSKETSRLSSQEEVTSDIFRDLLTTESTQQVLQNVTEEASPSESDVFYEANIENSVESELTKEDTPLLNECKRDVMALDKRETSSVDCAKVDETSGQEAAESEECPSAGNYFEMG